MGDIGMIGFDINFLHEVSFQFINTGILSFVMYKLLFKPVRKFMQARQDRISGQIENAGVQLKEAETLKTEYESKLKNIEMEKNDILETARKRGLEKETEIIETARTEAESLKNRANLEIEREKEKAKDEMKRQIIEVASAMASRFVKTSMDENSKAKLLDSAIADLGDVKWPN